MDARTNLDRLHEITSSLSPEEAIIFTNYLIGSLSVSVSKETFTKSLELSKRIIDVANFNIVTIPC